MKTIIKLLYICLFSVTGPLIILFGTFSGLIYSIESVFSVTICKSNLPYFFWPYFFYIFVIAIYAGRKSLSASGVRELNKETSIEGKKIVVVTTEDENRKSLRELLFGGYPLLVRWLLKLNGIFLYDVFTRPDYWPEYPSGQKEYPIIRFYKDNNSIEIRFPKNMSRMVLVRETKPNSHDYGDFREDSLFNWKILFVVAPLKFVEQIFS